MNDLMSNSAQSIKSFWQKPGGTLGKWITAIFLAGGLITFFKILPALLLIVQNTILLVLLLGVLAALLIPLGNSEIRLRLQVGYLIFLKKIVNLIIKTDPIAILKITIRKGHDRIEHLAEQISKLRQVMSNLSRKVQNYKSEAEENMLIAQEAKKKNIKTQIYLSTNQAGRLKGAVVELSTLYTRLETYYKILTKMHDNAEVLLKDKEQAVALQEDKWIAIRQSYSAMQSAMKALKGDKDERALFEDTMDYINDDLGMKMGEIDYMLDSSEEIMNNIDLSNGMFYEKGQKMLEEFEKKADSWLLTSDDPLAVKLPVNEQTGQVQTANSERPNQFSTLFQNKL